jgi:hypothetical protein
VRAPPAQPRGPLCAALSARRARARRLAGRLAAAPPPASPRRYPSALVFVAGPNAGARGRDAHSTTRRTFNDLAAQDYAFFLACVRSAVGAGLHAMAHCRCDVALLALVSGGLYAGPWLATQDVRGDFKQLVAVLLAEPTGTAEAPGPPLGRHFSHVVLVLLKDVGPEPMDQGY